MKFANTTAQDHYLEIWGGGEAVPVLFLTNTLHRKTSSDTEDEQN